MTGTAVSEHSSFRCRSIPGALCSADHLIAIWMRATVFPPAQDDEMNAW
jgi:hypothetical protein